MSQPAPVYIVPLFADACTAAPLIGAGTCNLCGQERPARTLVRTITHTGDETNICKVCEQVIINAFEEMWQR